MHKNSFEFLWHQIRKVGDPQALKSLFYKVIFESIWSVGHFVVLVSLLLFPVRE